MTATINCPHGRAYGTCLMCYHDLVSEQQSEITKLRAALKIMHQAILEFSHAQNCGPSWYTRGRDGMYAQVYMWLRRGLAAAASVRAEE